MSVVRDTHKVEGRILDRVIAYAEWERGRSREEGGGAGSECFESLIVQASSFTQEKKAAKRFLIGEAEHKRLERLGADLTQSELYGTDSMANTRRAILRGKKPVKAKELDAEFEWTNAQNLYISFEKGLRRWS